MHFVKFKLNSPQCLIKSMHFMLDVTSIYFILAQFIKSAPRSFYRYTKKFYCFLEIIIGSIHKLRWQEFEESPLLVNIVYGCPHMLPLAIFVFSIVVSVNLLWFNFGFNVKLELFKLVFWIESTLFLLSLKTFLSQVRRSSSSAWKYWVYANFLYFKIFLS